LAFGSTVRVGGELLFLSPAPGMQHCCILSNCSIFLSDNDLYIKVKRMVYRSVRLQTWTELLRSTAAFSRCRPAVFLR